MRNSNLLTHRASCWRARASVLVLVAAGITMMLGFAALAIDLGYVYAVHTEMRNAADASALAAATALVEDAALRGAPAQPGIAYEARARARAYATKNSITGQSVTLDNADIDIGSILDPYDLGAPFTVAAMPYNAVRVRVAKSADSANGPVELMFAQAFGKQTASLAISATAYINAHMSGYRALLTKTKSPLIPVTVRESVVDEALAQAAAGGGVDQYSYDPQTGEVSLGPDGIPEFTIYPMMQKLPKDTPEDEGDIPDGAGNFGLLNFASTSYSEVIPAQQIQNGLTQDDFTATLGAPEIRFYTDNGSPVTHVLDGSPGIKGGDEDGSPLFDALHSRHGDVIGFFVHTTVVQSGSDAVYTVKNIQFGRVMKVNLDSAEEERGNLWFTIQPAVYIGQEIITSSVAETHSTARAPLLIR